MTKKFILVFVLIVLSFTTMPLKAEELQGKAQFFYHHQCQYCEKEMIWLKELEEENEAFEVSYFDVGNKDDSLYFEKVLKEYEVAIPQVPFLIYGDEYFAGYLSKESFIEKQKPTLDGPSCNMLEKDCNESKPLALSAALFGLMDGFNPCAMWVLLVLISLLLQKEQWKDVFMLGGTFVLTTALFYYGMLNSWVNIRPLLPHFQTIQKIIAIVIVVFSVYSLYKQTHKKACHMKQGPVRKKVIHWVQKIDQHSSLIFSVLGIALLSIAVNLFELACSLGFPLAFIELLSMHHISGMQRQIYLIIYVFFFILDDLVILSIAGIRHYIKPFSTKWNHTIQMISSIVLLILGLILWFKPEILI